MPIVRTAHTSPREPRGSTASIAFERPRRHHDVEGDTLERYDAGRARLDRRARGGLHNLCERGFEPARVVAEHRGGFAVRTERDDRLAHVRGRLREDELFGGMPTVGDWVVVVDAGERYAIEAVLPRRTKVSRKTPWLKSDEHVLVANVDTIFIVTGLDGDFNVRRLERYLATAWDSGADPVIVLTKLDLNDDPAIAARGGGGRDGRPVHASATSPAKGSTARRVPRPGADDRPARIVGAWASRRS